MNIGILEFKMISNKDKTKNQLLKELTKLEKQVSELEIVNVEFQHSEFVLQSHINALKERNNSLNCLYIISNLIEKTDISKQEIFQGIIEIIPFKWQDGIYKKQSGEQGSYKKSSASKPRFFVNDAYFNEGVDKAIKEINELYEQVRWLKRVR